MGSPEEVSPPAKHHDSRYSVVATAPPAPDAPSTPAYSADWAASIQAYYSAGAATPPAFFPPVWAGPHLMSPYGTPIAYSPVYAPGAVYAHPSMAPGMGYPIADSGNVKSKGVVGKSGEGEKATSESEEDNASQRSSGGSASDGSSDTRDEDANPQENLKKRSYKDAIQEGEGSQIVTTGQRGRAPKLPVSAPGRTMVPSPATNLNIGMDLWNASHSGAPSMSSRPNTVIAPPAAGANGANGTIADCQWVQDERALKRERRKQSNRESARRSRLRKLQECDELARKVAELNDENSALRMELEHLHKICKVLEAENQHIAEELSSIRGNSETTSK